MPTYQYACTECGHEFDAFQSFSDSALTVCPVCGGRLRKVYGSVGVVFKGSGFYRTDSRNGDGTVKKGPDKGPVKPAKEGAAASSSSDSGSSSSSGDSAKSSTPAATTSSSSSTPSSSSGSKGTSSSGASSS